MHGWQTRDGESMVMYLGMLNMLMTYSLARKWRKAGLFARYGSGRTVRAVK